MYSKHELKKKKEKNTDRPFFALTSTILSKSQHFDNDWSRGIPCARLCCQVWTWTAAKEKLRVDGKHGTGYIFTRQTATTAVTVKRSHRLHVYEEIIF